MLLAIDIGNSTTKFGLYEGENLLKKLTIKTHREKTASEAFGEIEKEIPQELAGIAISSVIKGLPASYKTLGESQFGISPLFIDHTLDFGFSIKYVPPEDCGADRLVDAFAALEKFGSPVLVCDFGTATTIDLINENREYLGGIITPGPDTLGSALFEKTSKLPKINFAKPEKVIGDSTASSIRSGIYYGYIGLVDGLIKRMLGELTKEPKIVSTGGFAHLIAEESKYVEIIEDNLMLEGLRLIWEKNTGIENFS